MKFVVILTSCVVTAATIYLSMAVVPTSPQGARPSKYAEEDKCATCERIVEKFKQGLLSTSKSNFGGGNTKWEETNLGSYAFSETRFLEIIEDICSGQSQQCHQMLEKYEDVLENWWKNVFAKGTKSDLRDFFCIRRTKVCCPHGTHGPDCRDCKPDRKNPCNGNGICDGDGTHSGTGKCSCHPGYEGELCGKCSDGYYARKQRNVAADGDAAANNGGGVVCEACDQSCRLTCTKAGPIGCHSCKDGWLMVDGVGCSDLNECEDASMCQVNEYCVNNEGSYQCITCHKACSRCGGPDVESCTACASRYFKNNKGICSACHESCHSSCTDETSSTCDLCRKGWKRTESGECQDLDECTMPGFRLRCALDEYCVNSIGSYKCSTCHPTCLSCHGPGRDNCKQCKNGYHIEEGACVDTDECLKSSEVCPGTSRKCINLPGSYRCECVVGFKEHGGVCVPKSQNDDDNRSPSSSSSPSQSSSSSTAKSKQQQQQQPQPPANSNAKKKHQRKNTTATISNRDYLKYFGMMLVFIVVCRLSRKSVALQATTVVLFSGVLFLYANELDRIIKR